MLDSRHDAQERLRAYHEAKVEEDEAKLAALLAETLGKELTHSQKTRLGVLRNRIAKYQRGVAGQRV